MSELGVPNSGRADFPTGPNSIRHSYGVVYDRLGNGLYRVRAESGAGGGRANPFANGTVMTELELYKKLVECGAIKP